MKRIAVWASVCALVAMGKAATVAEIVIPAQADRIAHYAADELKYHLEKATGGSVEIVDEAARSSSTDRRTPVFYVGGTKAAKHAGIDKGESAMSNCVFSGSVV